MRVTPIVIIGLAATLAVAGCVPSGRLTPTGTGQTASGGLVPGQTPR